MSGIEQNYARCFASPSGKIVLQHLHKITTERVLGPNATDSELRWLESQRSLVRKIDTLIAQGQGRDKT